MSASAREERADVGGLEVLLALIQAHEHVSGHGERLLLARVGALHERNDLGRQPSMERDVFLEQRDDAPGHRTLVGAAYGLVEREGCDHGAKNLLGWRVTRHLCPRDALDEHLRGAVRKPGNLQHAPGYAHSEEIGGGRILRVSRSLCDEEDPPVPGKRSFDRGERRRPPDEQRHHHVRENDDVPKRQHGKSFLQLEAFLVAGQRDRHVCNIRGIRQIAGRIRGR